jgi:hypothetical protein
LDSANPVERHVGLRDRETTLWEPFQGSATQQASGLQFHGSHVLHHIGNSAGIRHTQRNPHGDEHINLGFALTEFHPRGLSLSLISIRANFSPRGFGEIGWELTEKAESE